MKTRNSRRLLPVLFLAALLAACAPEPPVVGGGGGEPADISRAVFEKSVADAYVTVTGSTEKWSANCGDWDVKPADLLGTMSCTVTSASGATVHVLAETSNVDNWESYRVTLKDATGTEVGD
ncbi:hypothetical protein [Microbacterium sp. ZW T5_56]|uniref:hypothetical protein n=1 Tax=Microbacterium sp. ZW T5_56 TaxID=3378081 RepID=UPI0038544328